MEYLRIGGKWLSGSALLCLALAGCNKAPQETQPVTGAPAAALQLATASPPPPTYAPPASSLPPAPKPVAYQPAPEHWRYLNDAYDMSDAFADTPPDYTVEYEGENPYVWRADDGAYRVVEWLPEGARYYYYEPGADEPFLIQDPDYSYAYDNGALVAVYTLAGALVADRIAAERRDYAARYYARGHDLYRAAAHDRRRSAYAATWRDRAAAIQAQHNRWQRGRAEQAGWRDWNRAHQAQEQTRWASERRHRQAYAEALRDRAAARRDHAPARRIEARPQPDAGRDHAAHSDNRGAFADRRSKVQRGRQPSHPQRNAQQPAAHDTVTSAPRHEPNHQDRHSNSDRRQRAAQPRAPQQQRVEQAQHRGAQQARQAERRQTPQTPQAREQRVQQKQAQAPRRQGREVRQQRQQALPKQHIAPPQAARPAPTPHAEPHRKPSHPAAQQHRGINDRRSQKDNRPHH